jgi:hypothetical protein
MKFCFVLAFLFASQGAHGVSLVRQTHTAVETHAVSLNSTNSLKYTVAEHIMNSPMLMQVQYELTLLKTEVVVDKIILGVVVAFGGSFWGVDRCLMRQVLLGTLKGVTCGGCGVWACIDAVLIIYNLLIMAPTIDVLYMKATFKEGTITYGCYAFLAAWVLNVVLQNCLNFMKPKGTGSEIQSGVRRNLSVRLAGPPAQDEIQEIFKKFDKDNNGMLDREELEAALKHLGVPQDQWDTAIAMADKNKDGTIDIDEFSQAFAEGILKTQTQGGEVSDTEAKA